MINLQFKDLVVNVYEVYTSTFDGQRGELVGVYKDYQQAYRGADKQGVHNTRGLIVKARGIILDDEVFVLKYDPIKIGVNLQEEKEKEIDAIFEKLTPDEVEKLKLDKEELKKGEKPFEDPVLPFNIPA